MGRHTDLERGLDGGRDELRSLRVDDDVPTEQRRPGGADLWLRPYIDRHRLPRRSPHGSLAANPARLLPSSQTAAATDLASTSRGAFRSPGRDGGNKIMNADLEVSRFSKSLRRARRDAGEPSYRDLAPADRLLHLIHLADPERQELPPVELHRAVPADMQQWRLACWWPDPGFGWFCCQERSGGA